MFRVRGLVVAVVVTLLAACSVVSDSDAKRSPSPSDFIGPQEFARYVSELESVGIHRVGEVKMIDPAEGSTYYTATARVEACSGKVYVFTMMVDTARPGELRSGRAKIPPAGSDDFDLKSLCDDMQLAHP